MSKKYLFICPFCLVIFLYMGVPISWVGIKSADAATKFGTSYEISGLLKKQDTGKVVNLMKEAGVEWIRTSDVWKEIEPAEPINGEHRYVWDERDFKLVRGLTEAGIEIMMTLNTYSGWAGTGLKKPAQLPKEEYLDDYYDFVYNTVKHYNANGARIKYWQIQNEPNARRWKAGDEDDEEDEDEDGKQNTPKDKAISYFKLLKKGASAVRDACPDCYISLSLASSVISDDAMFLREITKIGGAEYFDIIDFHSNYWPKREKDEGINQYIKIKRIAESIQRIMKEIDIQKPLWVSETSVTSGVGVKVNKKATLSLYSKKYGKYDYEFQSREVVKRFVIGFGSGVERVAWNKFSDQAIISKGVVTQKDSGNYKGLVKVNLEKKLSFSAYQLMTKKLKGFTEVKPVLLSGESFAYQFKVNGGDIYVLWAEKESRVDLKMGRLKITEINGKERIQDNSDLLLTSSPIFVEDIID